MWCELHKSNSSRKESERYAGITQPWKGRQSFSTSNTSVSKQVKSLEALEFPWECRKWNMFVVFGIEYWAGNPNFSCCSLITSSGNGFCVLLHPEGSLSYPQVPWAWAWHSPARESIWSFSSDLPNPTGNLGVPGTPFWWLLWKPLHVSVLSHSTPDRTLHL